MPTPTSPLRLLGVIAAIFGLLTLASGGQALFLGPEKGIDMGRVVAPVLVFNFVAGFGYVAAGIGIWKRQRWAARLAVALAAMTILMFTYLGVHIVTGGAFELRTVIAMGFRTAFWAMVAYVAMRGIRT